jgi:transcription initiation factor TFIIIB Brf1 subunit/transcription initiation factor TFIIB
VYEERLIVDEYEDRTFQDDSNKIQRIDAPINPIYENEVGTKLIIREDGKTRCVNSYSKNSNIGRNLYKIQKLLSSQNISQNLIEKTKDYYYTVAKNQKMQGRSLKNIILAIYYYSSKKTGYDKTFKQISIMFNVPERAIKKAYTSIAGFLDDPLEKENESNNIPINLIRDFIGEDKSKYEIKMTAFKILENIYNKGFLEGKSPKTLAGLSLFLSYKLFNDNLYDKKEFHKEFCTEATLMKAYDEIKCNIKMIIPENYYDKLHLL